MSSNTSHPSGNEHQKNLQTIETLVTKWKGEGNDHYHNKRFQPAIDQYSKIIQLLKLQHVLFQPHNSIDESLRQSLLNVLYVSYSNRCACHLQLNQVQPAYNDAKECINLKADWPKGYHRLANCLVRLERFDEALATYEQLRLLEPSPDRHREIEQAVQKVRDQMNRRNQPRQPSQPASPPQTFSIDWKAYWDSFQRSCITYYGKLLTWYMSLSEEYRNYLKLGVFALLLYVFFFSYLFSSSGYPQYRGRSYDYYGDYSSGYGYSRGLSWSAWIAIIAGAYYIPPMFPQVLGEQFARPFFGLNFTTFLWLVQLFANSNRGGGGGYYGRPRRHYY
eukprot:gene1730-1836_t